MRRAFVSPTEASEVSILTIDFEREKISYSDSMVEFSKMEVVMNSEKSWKSLVRSRQVVEFSWQFNRIPERI